jgi:molybdopterin/thiamine biosynthesis adenylyltransferase
MTTTGEKFFRVIGPAPAPTACSPFDAARSEDRLPAFDGGPADARARLAAAVVAVVGLGSVGRVSAEHLARVGVGTLQFIDRERAALKPQSLLTHANTRPQDVGQPKAANAGDVCKSIRPDMNVLVFDRSIEDLPPAALIDTDIVLLASDNLAAEVCVGQMCAWLGKPLLHVSVHGETLVAQARVFTNSRGDQSPCPRCAFGAAEEEHLRAGQHFPCDGGAALTPPTMSTSALCSLAGSVSATLALRHLLNLGESLRDAIHEWCGYTLESWSGPIRRRSDCPIDHRAWEVVRVRRPIADMSLREISHACAMPWPSAATVELDGLVTDQRDARRFFIDDGALPRVFICRNIACASLQPIADKPLSAIAPAAPRWVKVAAGLRTCLMVEGTER